MRGTGKEPKWQPPVGDCADGSHSGASGSGRPCPKVFYRHLPEQLAPGGRQMVLDPPSVAV